MPSISWFSAAGHINGGVSGSFKAEAKDEATAKNLRDIMGGFLAMANGDLDGQVIGLNSIMANQPALLNAKEVRVLLQFGRATRHPLLREVPLATDMSAMSCA